MDVVDVGRFIFRSFIVVQFTRVYKPTLEEISYAAASLLGQIRCGIIRIPLTHIDDHHRNVCTQVMVHILEGISPTFDDDGHNRS